MCECSVNSGAARTPTPPPSTGIDLCRYTQWWSNSSPRGTTTAHRRSLQTRPDTRKPLRCTLRWLSPGSAPSWSTLRRHGQCRSPSRSRATLSLASTCLEEGRTRWQRRGRAARGEMVGGGGGGGGGGVGGGVGANQNSSVVGPPPPPCWHTRLQRTHTNYQQALTGALTFGAVAATESIRAYARPVDRTRPVRIAVVRTEVRADGAVPSYDAEVQEHYEGCPTCVHHATFSIRTLPKLFYAT